MIEPTIDNAGTEDDTTILVPAHVIERKREEREQKKRVANTIVGQACIEEASAQ
jgi:hypothetical protein